MLNKLEGGIVSYDSNSITGGFGAKQVFWRPQIHSQDRVTIYHTEWYQLQMVKY
jgi:hypothetical protein